MGHKGVTYMDLSNTFDRLNNKLLIAKLKCYGWINKQLNFLEVTSRIATCALEKN